MTSSARYLLQIASKGEWKTVMYMNDLEEAWRTIAKTPDARVFDTWCQEPLTPPRRRQPRPRRLAGELLTA
jgi:hypothetical protein